MASERLENYGRLSMLWPRPIPGREEWSMPVISMFYGIIVRMFYFDTDQHQMPHIHVEYGEYKSVLSITEGEVLAGELPAAKLRLAQAWIEIHRDELAADWNLAIQGESVFRIDPLR